MRFITLAATTLLLTTGCASAPQPTLDSRDFAPSLNVNLDVMQEQGGVRIRDLRVGDGTEIRSGHRISIHYVGWLPDGRQFDGHAPPAPPLEFRLGQGEVIRGWDAGIVGMRVGGQRMLVVPPSLGYGRAGVRADGGRIGVPSNATLVFIIEVVRAI